MLAWILRSHACAEGNTSLAPPSKESGWPLTKEYHEAEVDHIVCREALVSGKHMTCTQILLSSSRVVHYNHTRIKINDAGHYRLSRYKFAYDHVSTVN